jgi:DNA-binding CsgD family transcriptional regulator
MTSQGEITAALSAGGPSQSDWIRKNDRSTVKSHVRHLLAKLPARSRAHAVAVGSRRGIIA